MNRPWSVLLFAFASLGCATATAPEVPATRPAVPDARPVHEQLDALLEADLAARPVAATALGDHRHDARWPDLSARGRSEDHARIVDALQTLSAIDPDSLGIDDRVDLDLLGNALRLEQFEHTVERPWERDAYWIVSLVGQGLDDLISRDYAAVKVRAEAAVARLEALPSLLAQADGSLKPHETMLPHLQVAIEQCDGLLELLQQEIPATFATAPPELRTRLDGAIASATPAVTRFREALRSKVPHAQGRWRLGLEAFETKLALTLQTQISADELRRLALLEHTNVRQAMADLARSLAPVLFDPQTRPREQTSDDDASLIRAVLEALAEAHGTPESLRDDAAATLDALVTFVESKHIVALDPREQLIVKWTPPHQRGVFVAGLAAPGPLEPVDAKLHHFYFVQPPPKAWSAELTESYLREYNRFMLEILSIHEAIPGHFVQLYSSKRGANGAPLSRIRRAFGNTAFIEGWAVYGERVMMEHGYAGAAPREEGLARLPEGLREVLRTPALRAQALALHALKFYLRTVTNALLDHGVHVGEMSKEEAIALMVEGAFQQQGEAQAKWVRAQVTSGQLSTYFAGAQAWLALRAQAQARTDAFDLAEFHRLALSHGAPPVPLLPRLLGWDDP